MTAHTLRGNITISPELAGVVYSYPYEVTDILTNVSAQPIDVPRLHKQNRSWFTLRPGERVAVPAQFGAIDFPDQVWQLVANRILSVSRLRNQPIADADNTDADFVPLHRRPSLVARYDAERSVLTVWRDLDDIAAQQIALNNLTPQIAYSPILFATADVGRAAEFPITVLASGTARFALDINDRTHSGVTATAPV